MLCSTETWKMPSSSALALVVRERHGVVVRGDARDESETPTSRNMAPTDCGSGSGELVSVGDAASSLSHDALPSEELCSVQEGTTHW